MGCRRTIGHQIRTLDNMLMRNMMQKAREHGLDELTVMHERILGYLYHNEQRDIFQKDVEAEFAIGRSTVTNILKLMEKKGYIRRESVEYDARLKRLALTDTGRRFHEEMIQLLDALEDQTTAGIPGEELEVFFSVIKKLKENIEKSQCIKGGSTC